MAGTRFSVAATFKGIDKFSAPVARMTTRMDRFNRKVRKGMGGLGKMTKRVARGMRSLTLTMGSLAVMGGFALKGLLSPAVKFQHALAALDAVTQGALSSQGRMNEMREKALYLGDKTIYTTNQITEAMKNLARAGLNADDILGSIAPILYASGASEAPIEDVSRGIISSMKALGLDTNAGNTTRFANLLAGVATKANTDILGLTEGMSKFGLVAKELGFGPDSAVAALAAVQDVVPDAASAGTQLKVFGARLVNIKGDAKALFKELDIKVIDKKTGSLKKMPEVIREIAEGVGRASNKVKAMKTLSSAFGTRGMLAAMALIRSSVGDDEKGFLKMLKKAREEWSGGGNAAEDIYKRRQETAMGALKETGAAFEAFLAQVGFGSLGRIERLADALSAWFRKEENVTMVKNWVDSVGSAFETHLMNIGEFWDANKRWIKGLWDFIVVLGKAFYMLVKLFGVIVTGLGELFGMVWSFAKMIAGVIPGGDSMNDWFASFAPGKGDVGVSTSVLGLPPESVSSSPEGFSGRVVVENRSDQAVGVEDWTSNVSIDLTETQSGADPRFVPGRSRAAGRGR